MIGYGGRLCVTRACKYVSSRRVPLRQIDAPAVLSLFLIRRGSFCTRLFSIVPRDDASIPSGREIIHSTSKFAVREKAIYANESRTIHRLESRRIHSLATRMPKLAINLASIPYQNLPIINPRNPPLGLETSTYAVQQHASSLSLRFPRRKLDNRKAKGKKEEEERHPR